MNKYCTAVVRTVSHVNKGSFDYLFAVQTKKGSTAVPVTSHSLSRYRQTDRQTDIQIQIDR